MLLTGQPSPSQLCDTHSTIFAESTYFANRPLWEFNDDHHPSQEEEICSIVLLPSLSLLGIHYHVPKAMSSKETR